MVYLVPQLFLLDYPHTNVGLPGLPTTALPQFLSTWLPISAPPTGLDECFFLTPSLLDFHTVQFSGRSGCF